MFLLEPIKISKVHRLLQQVELNNNKKISNILGMILII